jgi:hypothetical protein
MSPVRQIIYLFSTIDWTPEAVTAAGTIALAFLTFILAVSTFFLWLATRRLVKGVDKTAERQLRAYVFASDVKILQFSSIPRVKTEFKNFGKTPCDEITVSYDIECSSFPIAGKLPIGRSVHTSPLAPGSSFHRDNSVRITAEQRSEIDSGRAAIYIFGRVEYRDAFKGPRRHTNFRFFYTGDQFGRTGATDEGNDYS